MQPRGVVVGVEVDVGRVALHVAPRGDDGLHGHLDAEAALPVVVRVPEQRAGAQQEGHEEAAAARGEDPAREGQLEDAAEARALQHDQHERRDQRQRRLRRERPRAADARLGLGQERLSLLLPQHFA